MDAHLWLRIDVRVIASPMSLVVHPKPSRFPKVYPADELPHEQDVHTLDDLTLERGRVDQLEQGVERVLSEMITHRMSVRSESLNIQLKG